MIEQWRIDKMREACEYALEKHYSITNLVSQYIKRGYKSKDARIKAVCHLTGYKRHASSATGYSKGPGTWITERELLEFIPSKSHLATCKSWLSAHSTH